MNLTFQSLTKSIKNYIATSPASTETEPHKLQELPQLGIVAPWGTTNYFPEELDAKLALSLDMESGFQTLTEFCYGLRIATYREMEVDGEYVRKPVYYQPFEDFKETYNFNEIFLQRALYNFFRYANVFFEFSFDSSGKIVRIYTKDSPYCRISTLDKTTGLSKWLYQSAQWKSAGVTYKNESDFTDLLTKGLMSKIPLIDYRKPVDSIAEIRESDPKTALMGYHIKDYSPGDPYYGKSPWYPILNNGLLEIASDSASKIKAYSENLITIGYHFEINTDYFRATVDNWDELLPVNKAEHFKALQKDLDDAATGSDKAYKSFFSQFAYDNQGNIQHQLKINQLENPNRDTNVLNDLKFLNSTVASALRLDASLTGDKSGGSKEADAGSEKRLANNLLNQRLNMVRDQVLYMLTIIKYVNKWDTSIRFAIESEYHETLDKNPAGKTTTPTV
jgi:hypothetical protein